MTSPAPSRLLHRDFFAQAAATPDAAALTFGEQLVTYEELARDVDRTASGLWEAGVRASNYVGLHVERSVKWVCAMLGVLRVGAVVVPLPPSYPLARRRQVAEFVPLRYVVDARDTPYPGDAVTQTIAIEPLMDRDSQLGTRVPDTVTPDQPAFVLSSSGSTGTPKLIVRSHQSFYHRLTWTWTELPYDSTDVCAQKAHMTTTHAIYEVFEPLLGGSVVSIFQEEEVRNLEAFWSKVRSDGVSRLLMVPSALKASLAMPEFQPPQLRALVVMGEYVAPQLADSLRETFPAVTPIFSIYGSTEASSALLCDVRDSADGRELALGFPLTSDVRALVLDDELIAVSPGSEGRLFIGGTPLFDGYLNDPDRTANTLQDLPDGGERVYDTLDRVRLSESNEIFYVGRVDDTVKIRGFRVDLGDVERAMGSQEGVKQAAVVVDNSGDGDARLIGFYRPPSIARSAVYDTLRASLPSHMVPAALHGVDEMPLTSSAKIDRKALISRHRSTTSSPKTKAAFDKVEGRVAEAWTAVLGHTNFDARHSFFEAGGTSLSVFSLAQQLRERFPARRDDIRESTLYRHATVADQVHYLSDREANQVTDEDTPILVTLSASRESDRNPVFLIASAGGTLGAYDKLVANLRIDRDIVGIRDPYVWGERDPAESFQAWTGRYFDAMRSRQRDGPYSIVGYSSAGAFAIELAQRLTESGHAVELLVLIDPLGIADHGTRSFGHWALRGTYMRSAYRRLIRLAGTVRAPLMRAFGMANSRETPFELPMGEAEVERLTSTFLCSEQHLLNVSALFELNSGLPFAMSADDFEGLMPDQYFSRFAERVLRQMPEMDGESLRRIVIQYELQVHAQHGYRPARFDGRTVLVEPDTGYAGLVAQVLQPFHRNLERCVVPIGEPDEPTRQVTARFGHIAPHYRSMRDDAFALGLANTLRSYLG